MPAKTDEREYRNIDVKNFEIRTLDDGQNVAEGYATTWDEYLLWDDGEFRMFERFDPGAYSEADLSDVIMQYDHRGRVFARGSNNTLIVTPDEKGLHIRAYLGGTQIGRQLMEEIQGGYTTKMSQGFRVAEEKREIVEDRENRRVDIHRTITKVKKLYDVSAVSLPANDATEITARSLSEGVIAEVKQELAERAERQRRIKRLKLLMEVINDEV